ncbi:MAG TPA: hypothetical protein QGH16_08255 [Verrucomicrobiota bacterium]|nr:hypothetical protein [Verrucomicrobiota bacterium]
MIIYSLAKKIELRLAVRKGEEHKIWWLVGRIHRDKTEVVFEAEDALPVLSSSVEEPAKSSTERRNISPRC